MNQKSLEYTKKAHRFGRTSLIVGSLATLIYAFIIIVLLKVPANWKFILKGAGNVLILMIPVGLCEFLSIAPMIGPSGYYIMILTGNFTNLKIPSSIAAMQASGLDPASYTEESDVISTIAMAVSAVVSIVIIALGVALIVPLSDVLSSPVLKPAFDNIVPALFGALCIGMIGKHYKLAIAPFALGCILLGTGIINKSLVMPILVLAGVLIARLLFKKGLVKA